MTKDEKIRLFNGNGNWQTFSADGKIPVITMSDGPHGLRKQLNSASLVVTGAIQATCFPSASCIASSWDVSALELMGKKIAFEALKEGVHLMLGPGMNIKRSPLCGRNFEYFSEDPYLSGMLAAAYVNGMQKEGVGSCLKHFACNNQEALRQNSSSNVDERTLHEIYLRGFEIAIKKSHPAAVMCSYNLLNGVYTFENKKLLTDILKTEWGFKGAVISDWGACLDAVKAVKAGLDLAMPDSHGYFYSQLEKALDSGELTEQELEKSNDRIINLANRLNNMRSKSLSRNIDNTMYVDYASQHNTALKLALSSAVLLKNEGLLPLKAGSKIAVIGELAEHMKFQGGGSSHITTASYVNALDALKNEGFEVEFARGWKSGFVKRTRTLKNSSVLRRNAISLAKKAAAENIPVLLFCGLTEPFEGEGFDRQNMNLPAEQSELIKAVLKITKNVVLVTFSGAPVNLSPFMEAKSILHMYLCGQACGQACAALLSGNANPCGKLAETWPLHEEDVPCFGNFGTFNVDYKEGRFIGYRWYEKNNIPVQFPFGFGLSYTSFSYSNLNLMENPDLPDGRKSYRISFEIQNTGDVAGAEIAQVYVNKELRAFAKVKLEPNEVDFVEVVLDENSFSSYDTEKKAFVQIKGEYNIEVCASIKDIRLKTCVKIEGQTPLEDETPVVKHSRLHHRGKYTIYDSLSVLSKDSKRVFIFMKFMVMSVLFLNRGKSKENPAVKMALAAITDNPIVSFISTSNGAISQKFVRKLVKWANKK